RRFFDINDLAAIRMESPNVFAEAHRLLFELLGQGRVTGLRVDHPDGLWDPPEYFHAVQRGYFLGLCRERLPKQRSTLPPGPLPGEIADPREAALLERFLEAQKRGEVLARPLYVVGRRSSRAASGCRTTGPCTGPRATSSRTSRAASSSTARASKR